MGKAIVQVKSVEKTYRDGRVTTHALAGIDLEICPGEFLALVGPSGSGKSTLLNLVGGLDMPSSGHVHFEGTDLAELRGGALERLRLAKLGFVFQSHNLLPVLTALENVELVLALQGVAPRERRQRATEALDLLGLKEKTHHRPSELSGGQQQRVAVARAIVGRPALVLADEPTASLDSATAASLVALLRSLNEKLGTTLVFSTHDPRVMSHAKRVVTLCDGRITKEETR